jgi:indole-3-glycerol phosphate synthase
MNDVLAEILAHKRSEVEQARRERPIERLRAAPAFRARPRDFYAAVTRTLPRPNLIAEIKQKSPSAGLIRRDFDVAGIAAAYAEAGAAALSVLTDERYFGGSAAFVEIARKAVALPILRKEFVIDEYQVEETRAIGADAMLLIAEALEPDALAGLAERALRLDLTVIVEVHSRATLEPLLPHFDSRLRGRVLLGINNRDLSRQVTDLATFETLAPLAPGNVPLVAESGLKTAEDVRRVHAAGARAILVGESLLRQGDIAAGVRKLMSL